MFSQGAKKYKASPLKDTFFYENQTPFEMLVRYWYFNVPHVFSFLN